MTTTNAVPAREMPRLTDEQRTDCLNVDPFAGDFGAPGDRIFSDRIGKARKLGECGDCAGEIAPGEEQRRLTAVFDGALRSYRWCHLCCSAMALSWTDDGEAWEERFALRRMREQAGTTTTSKEKP